MRSNKKIIKNIFRLLLLLIFTYLGSQLIIYSFFEESKLVKINGKPINHDNKHMNTVKREWKGNYLVVKQYSNSGCNTKKYVRYNKNRIELLIIEPSGLLCWGTSYAQTDYTIYYNNMVSSLKAYFSEDTLDEKWCRVGRFNCVVNSKIMENYDQLKNFGFVKFGEEDYNLDNLNHMYLSDEKDNFENIRKNELERGNDLLNIITALRIYKDYSENGKYPISKNISRLNDKNSYIYKEFIEYIDEKYLIDPKNPEFYYGYRSFNGESYEIFIKSENPESKCELENGFCVTKSP